jgi:heat shock protein HtpX
MSPFLDHEAKARHRYRNLTHTVAMIAAMGALMLISATLIWGWWGMAVALLSVAAVTLLAPRVSPETVMRLYRAKRVEPRHGGQLIHLLTVLAERAELPSVPSLYVVPSTTLNAFATGSERHSAIAVTEALLRRLDPREIAGVLAHEMSHIRNNDLLVMGLADVMTRFMQMLAWVAVALAALNIPAMLLGLDVFPWPAIALLYLAPAASSLLQLALSRTREFDADLEAAGLTGDPQGLASALRTLENAQGSYWEDLMLPPVRRVPYPSLLRSHPPTEERIERLASLVKPVPERRIVALEGPVFTLVGLGPGDMLPRRRWPGLWY